VIPGEDPGSSATPTIAALSDLLREAVTGGVAPGAAAVILHRGRLVHASAAGVAQQVPISVPLTLETWFDLASLTKPLAVGLICLRLCARGQLELEAPAADLLRAPEGGGWEGIRISHLLEHRAGLPAWKPYFKDDTELRLLFRVAAEKARRERFAQGRLAVPSLALQERPIAAPGDRTVYSDVGFLALGRILELLAGVPLEELFRREVRDPLGLADIDYFDLREVPPRPTPTCAATGLTRPREPAPGQEEELAGMPRVPIGPRPGEVDDDNAFACGGVAGHSGLFGTPGAVARLGQSFLEACSSGSPLGPSSIARRFRGLATAERGLAWERPSHDGSSIGSRLGRGALGAVGHLGFTGCSLWVDLDAELVVALCTNRTHPTRTNQAIRQFRPRFHDAVAEAVGLS
jgi:CubicO group peptidase (beta-lactamase class C family)